MSDIKHTPGPWRVMNGKPTKTRGIDVIAEQHNAKIVASCWFSHLEVYKGEPEARARADARLIAAAPQLFEALREICEFWAYGLAKPDGTNPSQEDKATVERIALKALHALHAADPSYVHTLPAPGTR